MGTIPPKSLFDFTVIFSPTVAKLHTDTAYLQVDGFQDRIPLTISGLATGAQLTASTQDMDLGHIMVHERNNFEVGIPTRIFLIRVPRALSETLNGP